MSRMIIGVGFLMLFVEFFVTSSKGWGVRDRSRHKNLETVLIQFKDVPNGGFFYLDEVSMMTDVLDPHTMSAFQKFGAYRATDGKSEFGVDSGQYVFWIKNARNNN